MAYRDLVNSNNLFIVSADIDPLIAHLVDLPELPRLACVNNTHQKIIEQIPIYIQWKYINHNTFRIHDKTTYHGILIRDYICKHPITNNFKPNNDCVRKFRIACTYDFLEYAIYLLHKYPNYIIHQSYNIVFRSCCVKGHFDVVKFLYELRCQYSTIFIDIQQCNRYVFTHSPPHIIEWLNTLE